IQRQYDEVIAPHYDSDPQGVTTRSLERALNQICQEQVLGDDAGPFNVLDVGIGTGSFLARLKALGGERVQPFGLDLSEKMIESPRKSLPARGAPVDDAATPDDPSPGQPSGLFSTHFTRGFVPLSFRAPKIGARLDEGGSFSLVGGTTAVFPALQAKAASRP